MHVEPEATLPLVQPLVPAGCAGNGHTVAVNTGGDDVNEPSTQARCSEPFVSVHPVSCT